MVATSAATDEVDDLHYVATAQLLRRIRGAVAQNCPVVLDYHEARVNSKRVEKLRERAIPRNIPRRAVHRQGDVRARCRSPNHRLKYSW